jgi:peptidoglycan/xylan/chitin deacetylase (PgdA/CDA1 family)
MIKNFVKQAYWKAKGIRIPSDAMQSKRALILNYHHIVPNHVETYNLLFGYAHSVRHFEAHLKWLKKHFIPSTDWELKNGVVITFDDCSMYTFKLALPLLEKYGFKAYFFVVEECLGSQIWVDRYFQWLSFVPPGAYQLLSKSRHIQTDKDRMALHHELWPMLGTTTSLDDLLDDMNTCFRFDLLDQVRPGLEDRMRTVGLEEIEAIKAKGHFVGHHSKKHRRLSTLPTIDLKEEISMENRALFNTNAFAIPFGAMEDYNDEVLDALEQANYSPILLNHATPPKGSTFGRLNMPNTSRQGELRFRVWNHLTLSQ